MANTTGHEEAKAQIAGETGYEAAQTDVIIVYSDGRTEHASLFAAGKNKIAATAAESDVK